MKNFTLKNHCFIFKSKVTRLVIMLYLLSNAGLLFAQDGTLDTTFNTGIGANDLIYTTSIQSDGKILIGGDFTSYNGTNINRLARLNIDGSLDTTFHTGTGLDGAVMSIIIQNDGKIIIGGFFSTYNGNQKNNIVRLNTDGSIDASLNPGTGPNNLIWTMAIQNDGKIMIGGFFTSYNGFARNHIARLNINGSIDSTFDSEVGANDNIYSLTIQDDEKIIIGGDFTSYQGITRNYIARLNIDGSLDQTFNPGTGANNCIYAVSIQKDKKIVIGGFFTSYNGVPRNYISRLNIDGSLDSTFNQGAGPNTCLFSLYIQGNGKIIIGGEFYIYSGTLRNCIARINANGDIDPTFNPGLGANDGVCSISGQQDGKIIIGGYFRSYNGNLQNRIARLNNTNTGILLNKVDKDLVVYPNPTCGIFTLEINKKIPFKDDLSLNIFNAKGEIVKTGKINSAKTEIDINYLPNGVYFVLLSDDKLSVIKRIIMNK